MIGSPGTHYHLVVGHHVKIKIKLDMVLRIALISCFNVFTVPEFHSRPAFHRWNALVVETQGFPRNLIVSQGNARIPSLATANGHMINTFEVSCASTFRPCRLTTFFGTNRVCMLVPGCY
jgi:hypothetical protein